MEEVLQEGKQFRLVHESELPDIVEYLGDHLPDSLKFHQTIETYLKDRVWEFHFYITKTWPDQAVILHFPGMTRSPNGKLYESFSVFCPCEQLDHLELLIAEDILIDWTQPIYLNFTHIRIMDKLEELYSSRGMMHKKMYGDVYGLIEPTVQHQESESEIENVVWLTSEQNVEVSQTIAYVGFHLNWRNLLDLIRWGEVTVYAEDAEMLQLTPEHAQTIHDLYPANHMECLKLFEKLIENLPCYGIFSSSGDLAAWMVQSYYGAMFSMQTKPEYRRKGYGLILAKYLTNVVRKRGYIPFVVIRPENDPSKGLYAKVGFKKYFETVRAILRPHEMSSDAQGGGTEEDHHH